MILQKAARDLLSMINLLRTWLEICNTYNVIANYVIIYSCNIFFLHSAALYIMSTDSTVYRQTLRKPNHIHKRRRQQFSILHSWQTNFMLQKKTEEKWFKQQIKTTHVWDKQTVYCNIVKWMNERYRFTTVKYVHLFQWSKKWAKWKKQREKNHRQRLVMERWKKMVNCNMCVIWRFMWRANGEGKRQYTTCICARATEPKCWESEEKDNSLPFNNDTKRKFI